MTEIQNSKRQRHPTKKNSKNVWVIVICLLFGFWDLGFWNAKWKMPNEQCQMKEVPSGA